MTTPQSGREAFEAWISAPPFEQSVSRLNASSAWPGSYRDIATDLAWQAWQAALAQQGWEVGEPVDGKLPPFARTHEGQQVYSLAYARGRKKGREDTAAPKQQAVTDEDVKWCRDIAGDLREAGGPTNAMRLVALERLIRAALPSKTEVE